MLNQSTLLSELRSVVNALSCRPTAERKAQATRLLQELTAFVDGVVVDGQTAAPSREVKRDVKRVTAKPSKAVKVAKASPTEIVADQQEKRSATPKGFAVTKADKVKAAERVAKQQAEAVARQPKPASVTPPVKAPKVQAAVAAPSSELLSSVTAMQDAMKLLSELSSATAVATTEVRKDLTSLEARVAALEAKPKASAKRSPKQSALADILMDSDFDGMPW